MDRIFSEHFSRSENILTQIDARIKIIFSIAAIVVVLTSVTFYVPLIVIILTMLSLLAIRIPFKIIILRMSAPLGVALTVLFIKILFSSRDLDGGPLIMFKILGSTSIMLFLSMTTALDKLLAASCWFRMPRTWVEICLITYRYIFVLLEDASTIIDAQRVRLGYSKLTGAFRSIGTLAGAIIIRAYDQSVATYEAMLLRGYKGKGQILCLENRLMLRDVISVFIFMAILLFLLAINMVSKI